MKYVVLATVLFLDGVELTWVRFARPALTPVVRLRTSDGFYVTLLQPRTAEKQRCTAAIERFEHTIQNSCPGCYVESTDCAVQLAGIEDALASGDPLPVYTVAAGETRMAILGPPGKVRAWCKTVAAQMASHGMPAAACVEPQPTP